MCPEVTCPAGRRSVVDPVPASRVSAGGEQELHRRGAEELHREMERRHAQVRAPARARATLDQPLDCLVPAVQCREAQRFVENRLLVARGRRRGRPPDVGQVRAMGDRTRRALEASHQVDPPECRGRPERERRDLVLGEQLGRLAGAVVERGLERREPSRRVGRRVGAGVEQHPHELGAVEARGEVERAVQVVAALDQEPDDARVDAEVDSEPLSDRVGLCDRLEQRPPGAVMRPPGQGRILVEQHPQPLHVAVTDRRERRQHLGRAFALALVLAPDALDARHERTPRLEAVLAGDYHVRVVNPPRHIRPRPCERLLVAGHDPGSELLRPLLVERHGLEPDPGHRALGRGRLRRVLELRPRAVAMLDGDHVLRVCEPETLARPGAEHRLRPGRRLGRTRAERLQQRLRFLLVPLEIHDDSLLTPVVRSPGRREVCGSSHILRRGGSVPSRGPDAPSRAQEVYAASRVRHIRASSTSTQLREPSPLDLTDTLGAENEPLRDLDGHRASVAIGDRGVRSSAVPILTPPRQREAGAHVPALQHVIFDPYDRSRRFT